MQLTSNYSLKKPEGMDIVNIDDFNANTDIIDTQLKLLNTNKVDKVEGKQLSTNDYTNAEKSKLAGLQNDVLKVKGVNYKDALANPSEYDVGQTIFLSDNPTNKFNNVAYCVIVTIKPFNSTSAVQYIYPYLQDAPIYYRVGIYKGLNYPDTWKEWRAIETTVGAQAKVDVHAAQNQMFTATLINGFGGEVAYQKLAHGLVRLTINLNKISSVATNMVICNLPFGYRPIRTLIVSTSLSNHFPFGGDFSFQLVPNGDLVIAANNKLSVTANTAIDAEMVYYAYTNL